MTTGARRIDHVVLAVRDLDAAAALYRRLGFQVGARNRHPWGTENHVVQLGSSFLELITVAEPGLIPSHGPRRFSFGRFVADHLERREGLAMLVLDSADAAADAAAFRRAGLADLEPFSFERTGRTADGTATRVAFTLAFASDDRLPDAAFFTCQQHVPEAFWSPALQRHANGATDVTEVVLEVADPADHTDLLTAFTGAASSDGRRYALAAGGTLRLARTTGTEHLTGFAVAVPTLDPVLRVLRADGVRHERSDDRVAVGPDECFGVQVELVRTT